MSQLHGFRGGLTGLVFDGGDSTGLPIQPPILPERLYLPMSEHDELLIEPGAEIVAGQPLVVDKRSGAVTWHAPAAGELVEVADHPAPHFSGLSLPTLIIEPDGSDRRAEQSPRQWSELTLEGLVEIASSAGLSGLGGAGFPTWVKLSGTDGRRLTTLIINGVECEPGITCDDMLIREQAAAIVTAAAALAELLKVEQVSLALEDDCPQAVEALKTEIAEMQPGRPGSQLAVVTVPSRYPSGSEKQLIENLIGKQVPQGGLPIDIGVLCLNVGTLFALHQAVTQGAPLVSRVVTITGKGVAQPQNREVLFGTPIDELLKACGGATADATQLVMGGPMMGFALRSAEVPIVKISNCVLALVESQKAVLPLAGQQINHQATHQPCIRCGDCASVCPAGLLPQQLYWFAKSGEHDKAEHHHLFDCIECGACAYVCPSKIPLVQYYRATKGEIRAERGQQVGADIARGRMEARDARLIRREEQAQQRRQAKRARRDSPANRPGNDQDSAQVDKQHAHEGGNDKQPVAARPAPSAEVMAAVNRAKQLQLELELDGDAPSSASKRQETEQANVASDKPRSED